jgi:hypothetical protein
MVFSNTPFGAIAPGSWPPWPGSIMINGFAAASARLGVGAAMTRAAPNNALPKPLRPGWQLMHMRVNYHKGFKFGYDYLKSLRFCNPSSPSCRLGRPSAIEAPNGV